MKVKKQYKLEKDDFSKFGLYVTKKNALIQVIIVVFIAFLATYIILDRQYFLLGAIISSAISVCIILPVLYYSTYSATMRNYSKYNDEIGVVETTIDKRGFSQKSVMGKVTVPFNKIYKVCESKHGIYVYVSSRQSVILSKKHFDSDEIATIKELFKNNIAKKKLHLI